MNRIIMASLASVALCLASTSQVFGTSGSPAEPHHHPDSHQHNPHHPHHKHARLKKIDADKSSEAMAKECEDRLNKNKDSGASLAADLKAEFDYNLESAALESKMLKDTHIKNHKKHFGFCNRHLEAAERIVKRHEYQLANAKKAEERQAKAEERKTRAEAREAKAKARAEARALARQAKKESKGHGEAHKKESSTDHGAIGGESKAKPGSEAEKHISEEKK